MRKIVLFILLAGSYLQASGQATKISGVINTYTSVSAVSSTCPTTLTVGSSTGFSVNDNVLIIQMKGVQVDTSNSAKFGTILNYNNAGNYEFDSIASISGTSIKLKNKLSRSYDPGSIVQLIRVPYYKSANVTDTLKAAKWNGTTGGVIVFFVKDTLTLNKDISTNKLGFKGGNYSAPGINYGFSNYYDTKASTNGGDKGEGASTQDRNKNYQAARGAMCSGGGGGDAEQCGGGGGSNYGTGGIGGSEVSYSTSSGAKNGGRGGVALTYSTSVNKIYLGGGGGGGQNYFDLASNGGSGGGIIIIRTKFIDGNSYTIKADGESAATGTRDGAGGGGAGGTILLDVSSGFLSTTNIEANGGNGGNDDFANSQCHAPGGGGGGGAIWFSASGTPSKVNTTVSNGKAGTLINSLANCYGSTFDATNGGSGSLLYGLTLPIGVYAVKVNAGKDTTICVGYSASLQATGNKGLYSWSPGKTLSDSTIANPTAKPGVTTTYIVKLTGPGCPVTDTVKITVDSVRIIASPKNTTICSGDSVALHAKGGLSYTWFPNTDISDYHSANPVVKPAVSRYYYVTGFGKLCSMTDSVYITVIPKPKANAGKDTTICFGSSAKLHASGGVSYLWFPNYKISSITSANPVVTPDITTKYNLVAFNGICSDTTQVTVTVLSIPVANAGKDTTICQGLSATLHASGGTSYQWLPNYHISKITSANPAVNPDTSTTYTLIVSNSGCRDTDDVKVTVLPRPKANAGKDTAVCFGSVINLHASGGASYLWSPNYHISATSSANTTVNPDTSMVYTLVAYNGFCTDTTHIKISVALQVIDTGWKYKTAICAGDSLKPGVAATKGFLYSWTSLPIGFTSTLANPAVSPSSSIIYYRKKYNTTGCTRTDSILVSVNQSPAPDAGTDVNICPGEKTSLVYINIPGHSFLWTNAAGYSSTDTAITVKPSKTTTYYLNETINASGCSRKDSVTIRVNAIPQANTGGDKSVCIGDKLNIGSAGVAGNSYKWTSIPAGYTSTLPNDVVGPNVSTIFILTETSPAGCSNTDSAIISVNLLPSNPKVKAFDTICAGSGITLSFKPLPASTHTWASVPAGFNSSDSVITVSPFSDTRYILKQVLNTTGCTRYDTVHVAVKPSPHPAINGTLLLCDTGYAAYSTTAAPGNTWLWQLQGGSLISSGSKPDVVVHWGKAGLWNLYVTEKNNNGCQVTDTVVVDIEKHPVAGFNIKNGCLGDQSFFTDSSSFSDSSFWDFGDKDTSKMRNPLHTFLKPGLYNVRQIVKSLKGCTDTITKSVNIYPLPKLRWIIVKDTGRTISYNVSDTSYASYLWSFGDGQISTRYAGTHTYPATDTYTLHLDVKNSFGCELQIDSPASVHFDFPADTVMVFPNPYTDQFTIFYIINHDAHIQASLSDELGRRISDFMDLHQEPGSYTFNYDSRYPNLRAAMYFLRFKIDGKLRVFKVIKIQ